MSPRVCNSRILLCSSVSEVKVGSSAEEWERDYKELKLTEPAPASKQGGSVFGMLGDAFGKAVGGNQMSDTEEARAGPKQSDPPILDGFRVVNEFTHTKESFTQGLCWDAEENIMFEGSGGPSFSHGSRISRKDLETGDTLAYRQLPKRHFGEGMCVLGDKAYQLTWRSNVGFIYDKTTLALKGQFQYQHEGWGITSDGSQLIVSDGTAYLHFWDPDTCKPVRDKLLVRYLGKKTGVMTPLRRLNDLQWVKGKIYANVWEFDRVAVIDPETGIVERFIELKGLLDESDPWIQKWSRSDRCLNGIAYDDKNDRLFITGKLWTKLYEVEVLPGAGDKEEQEKAAPPKDYYSSVGSFDPLGMGQ